jgi:hypothetical protein
MSLIHRMGKKTYPQGGPSVLFTAGAASGLTASGLMSARPFNTNVFIIFTCHCERSEAIC